MHADVGNLIGGSGWLLTIGTVFLWGLAMNLTPCVYPMIPITISYFGGTSEQGSSRSRGMIRAILFVLGMAITYSVLGVSAALTGKIFGASLGNPYAVGFVSAVMAGMGLSMLGVFQIAAPSSWLSRIQEVRDRLGLTGALFFGLVIGVVMAPCVGPFITALLAYVGARGDPLLGFWLFLILALGMGSPYIVLGFFTATIKSLPRPGTWMLWLERLFGLVLIGYAFSFWKPFIPSESAYYAVMAGYVSMAAVALAFFSRAPRDPLVFRVIKALTVLAALVASALLSKTALDRGGSSVGVAGPNEVAATRRIAWQTYSEGAVKEALVQGRPVMIDFYAKWCAACNELDEKTYTDPKIIEMSSRFLNLRADFTQVSDVESSPVAKRFRIQGLPTIVFISPDGKERNDLRLEEFAPPGRMRALMEQATLPR